MKRIKTFIPLLLLPLLFGLGKGIGNALPTPVVQYRMNENNADPNVYDAVGGHTGTAQQNTNLLHTAGKIGGGLKFNGTSDYIFVDTSANPLVLTEFSFTFWIKTSQQICNFEIIYLDELGSGSLSFILKSTSGRLLIYAPTVNNLITTSGVNDNQWHFVALTRQTVGNVFSLYVDGQLEATDASSFCFDNGLIEQWYGWMGYENEYFAGSFDDMCIYDFALTPEQISQAYNMGSGREQ